MGYTVEQEVCTAIDEHVAALKDKHCKRDWGIRVIEARPAQYAGTPRCPAHDAPCLTTPVFFNFSRCTGSASNMGDTVPSCLSFTYIRCSRLLFVGDESPQTFLRHQ
jgi:hypothetical protein